MSVSSTYAIENMQDAAGSSVEYKSVGNAETGYDVTRHEFNAGGNLLASQMDYEPGWLGEREAALMAYRAAQAVHDRVVMAYLDAWADGNDALRLSLYSELMDASQRLAVATERWAPFALVPPSEMELGNAALPASGISEGIADGASEPMPPLAAVFSGEPLQDHGPAAVLRAEAAQEQATAAHAPPASPILEDAAGMAAKQAAGTGMETPLQQARPEARLAETVALAVAVSGDTGSPAPRHGDLLGLTPAVAPAQAGMAPDDAVTGALLKGPVQPAGFDDAMHIAWDTAAATMLPVLPDMTPAWPLPV